MVWSRQEFGDAYAYKPVFETKATENQQLYEVVVENENGETETYLTTSEHPFYIDGLGWLKASLLEAGMPLLDRNGNSGSLKVRSQTQLEQWDTVYNFEVEDYVTYHIGKFGVWVHNECCKVGGQRTSGGNPALTDDYHHPDNVAKRQNSPIVLNNTITHNIVINGKTQRVTVDLTETINRMNRGQPKFSQDGTIYMNRTEPSLPKKPGLTYEEWTVELPNQPGIRNTSRLVKGSDGSLWYTPNHYGIDRNGNKIPGANHENTWIRLK